VQVGVNKAMSELGKMEMDLEFVEFNNKIHTQPHECLINETKFILVVGEFIKIM